MSLYIPVNNAIYIHIPKTGGTYVRNMFQACNIRTENPNRHQFTTRKHSMLWQLDEDASYSFAFVRHPLRWYESFWKYQVNKWIKYEQNRWHPWRCLEACESNDFNEFISKIIEMEPGYVTRMYEWYLGPRGAQVVDFVGRTETLKDDLLCVLRELGHNINMPKAHSVPKANTTDWRKVPEWDPALKDKILELEKPTIERFYQDSTKFTIMTPTIERDVLKRCCESVNKQTYDNWEHLVIIDGDKINIDVNEAPYKHPNRRFLKSGKRHHDVGNHARNMAFDEVKGDYIMYLDDDNYFMHEFVLKILSEKVKDTDWGVYPVVLEGKYFFNDPPGLKKTDVSQIVHKPVIKGEKITYPAEQEYDADGRFIERLKKISKPKMLIDVGPLVMYEKATGWNEWCANNTAEVRQKVMNAFKQ
jgi:hypothetical protein